MEIIIRSLIFYVGMWIFTVPFAFITMFSFFISPLKRNKFISIWAKSILFWLKITCNLSYKVTGIKNIPKQPCIIFSKHQSAWETLALQEIFPSQVWVLKKELLMIPFFGWGLAMTSPIAINRSSGRKALNQILEQGLDRINKGFFVVIFPEGTRTKPKEKRKYHIGGSSLAVYSKRDVIPVAHNAGYYWPKNSLIKKPGEIKINIGPPIKCQELKANEINNKAKSWIEKTVLKLNV